MITDEQFNELLNVLKDMLDSQQKLAEILCTMAGSLPADIAEAAGEPASGDIRSGEPL